MRDAPASGTHLGSSFARLPPPSDGPAPAPIGRFDELIQLKNDRVESARLQLLASSRAHD